jgi:hypothetical protein
VSDTGVGEEPREERATSQKGTTNMKIDLIHAAYFTPISGGRWGLPIIIEDEPGCAKTSFIKAFAAEWGEHCEVLSPGERGEGAFGVVPVPVDGRLTYPRPDWTDVFFQTGFGLVFNDEITNAPPILQSPMLGLTSDRRIGTATLPGGVRVMAACNPPELAAHGFDLAPPLANRFGWIQWGKPSIGQHQQFMMNVDASRTARVATKDPRAEEARVLAAWNAGAWARAVGTETAFLAAQPHFKNRCPKVGDTKLGRAWPSDRTWEMATRALAASYVHNLSQESTDIFVSAFIGHEAYVQFATFAEKLDLPAAADVLDEKVKYEWEPKRLDRSAAVVAACAALVVPADAQKRDARASILWKLLGSTSSFDIVFPAATTLVQNGLQKVPGAGKVLSKLFPVSQASGVTSGVSL